MPELPDQQTRELATKIRVDYFDFVSNNRLSSWDREKLVTDESDMKYIGSGAECVVFSNPGRRNPDNREDGRSVVIAVDYGHIRSPIDAKRIYYGHRIFSTLFPHNFPRFYSSFSGDPTSSSKPSGTIRQEIIHSTQSTQELYPFSNVQRVVKALRLPVFFDSTFKGNFGVGEDGGEYYLDKILVDPYEEFNVQSISDFMNKNGYSKRDKQVVVASIKRLDQLKKESERKNFIQRLFGKRRKKI